MTKDIALNLLAVIDGKEKPTKALIQYAHTCGSVEKLHQNFIAFMRPAGWQDGGAKTIEAALITPHVRDWNLLVWAQREPMEKLLTMRVEATYAEDAE